MVQYIAIGVVVAIAVAYAVFRICKTLQATDSHCAGCSGYALCDQIKTRKQKRSVKQCKNVSYNKK